MFLSKRAIDFLLRVMEARRTSRQASAPRQVSRGAADALLTAKLQVRQRSGLCQDAGDVRARRAIQPNIVASWSHLGCGNHQDCRSEGPRARLVCPVARGSGGWAQVEALIGRKPPLSPSLRIVNICVLLNFTFLHSNSPYSIQPQKIPAFNITFIGDDYS